MSNFIAEYISKAMNIYLLRSPELPKSKFSQIYHLIDKNKGAVKFIVDKKEIHFDDSEEADINVQLESKTWDSLFEVCKGYRKNHKGGMVTEQDVIVLLTEYPNEKNWFSAWQTDNKLNFFIQTSKWEKYGVLDSIYPVVYELISIPLYIMLCSSNDELMKRAHKEWQEWGCAFDMCTNKSEVNRKLLSGDLCPSCKELLKNKSIDVYFKRQFFDTLEMVRSNLLLMERSFSLNTPSRLLLNTNSRRLEFLDLSNFIIKLSPKQIVRYIILLKYPDIKYITDMERHKGEIDSLYRKYKRDVTEVETQITIKNLIENAEDFSTFVTNFNKLINAQLGPALGPFYIVNGDRETGYWISIDRKLVTIK